MSARKLSRFAGLVLVLAAVVGGISAAVGGELTSHNAAAVDAGASASLLDTGWT